MYYCRHYRRRTQQDKLVWCNHKEFRVKSLCLKATTQSCQGAIVDSLVCTFWQNIAPPKVKFMVWLALPGKLNTKDLLARKGILPAEVNSCTFYAFRNDDLITYWSLLLCLGACRALLLVTRAKTLKLLVHSIYFMRLG